MPRSEQYDHNWMFVVLKAKKPRHGSNINILQQINDKEEVVHVFNRIGTQPYKKWNNAICSNMDGARAYHSKWSKPGRK